MATYLYWQDNVKTFYSNSASAYNGNKQQAQLMLTNPRDAFRGQSRSPDTVFHLLGIVSSCAIVTLCLRRAVFPIFDFKICHDLEIWVRGHSRSLKVEPFDRLHIISYYCSAETLSLRRPVFEIFDPKYAVTLKTGLGVRQGHWKRHHEIMIPLDPAPTTSY